MVWPCERASGSPGDIVFCDEIDLCDTEFYTRALALLERSDTELTLVPKPWWAPTTSARCSAGLHTSLQRYVTTVCQYRGTDTHGLKAFRREALMDVVEKCLDKDVFASEFVIRAHRSQRKSWRSLSRCAKSARRPSVY